MRLLLRYVLLCVVFCPVICFGQKTAIKFKHLTINEGLSQNTVYCTLQDNQGFIWIATEDGLNRYDGYNFNIYKHNKNLTSLSSNQVNYLFEDRDKNLWIGTTDGLNIYDREKDCFKRLYTQSKKSSESNDFITGIVQDKAGNLWIATYDGLKRYNKTANTFATFLIPNPKGDKLINKIQTISLSGDVLWIGTGNDLKLFSTKTHQYLQLPGLLNSNTKLKNSGIRSIKIDKAGNYWIGTENDGVFKYSPSHNSIVNYRQQAGNPNSLLSNIVRDVLVADTNEIWIGTREGLSILRSGKISNYTYDKYNPDALTHNSIRHFMKDRAGNIWLGTYAGGVDIFLCGKQEFHQYL